MHTDQLRYALAAAARGWPVFPLVPGGKEPLKGWPWKERNTTDPDTIRATWARQPYNVGIATGPARLAVLDLDMPKPGEIPPPEWNRPGINDGADVLAALCDQHGQPLALETFQVRTRRGGLHLYYTAPEGTTLTNTQGSLGWLIDTRSTGGYVVGPGSRVTATDGPGTYHVINAAPPAPLPSWLADQLTPAPLPEQRPVTVTLTSTDRHSAYLQAAIKGELERVTNASAGRHNRALYGASVALGQLVAGGELSEHEVTTLLLNAAQSVGQRYGEAARTIGSGMRAGARRPRTVAA